jgi:hypothetical protein
VNTEQAGSAQVGNGDAIEINANNFAGRATAGNLNIVDLTGNLTTANLTLEKSATAVNGALATGDVCLDVVNGSLNVEANVNAGNDAALRARDNINLNAGSVNAGRTASLEATNGSIVDNTDAGADLDVNATNFVALANGSVGSLANGIETTVANIAARGTNGAVVVTDLTGNITVTQLTTVKGNTPVTGINAGTNVCVETAGTLDVNSTVTAANVAALRAANNINLQGLVTGPQKVSLEAGGGGAQAGVCVYHTSSQRSIPSRIPAICFTSA